jgi:hypothetical protein
MKQRLSNLNVYYPFFKTRGSSVAVFFRHTIYECGGELIEVPLLERVYSSRVDFIRAIRAHVRDVFGDTPKWSKLDATQCDEATSTAFQGETRAAIGFPNQPNSIS